MEIDKIVKILEGYEMHCGSGEYEFIHRKDYKALAEELNQAFSLAGVGRSKPKIDYKNLGYTYGDLFKETGERVFYEGKDITDEFVQTTEDKTLS